MSISDSDRNMDLEIQSRGVKEMTHTMEISTRTPSPGRLALAPTVRAHYGNNCTGPLNYMNRCLAYWYGFRSYTQPSEYELIPGAPGEGGGVVIPTEESVKMSRDACPSSSGGGGPGGCGKVDTIPAYTLDDVPVVEAGVERQSRRE